MLLASVLADPALTDSLQRDASNTVMATLAKHLGLAALAAGLEGLCSKTDLFARVGGAGARQGQGWVL